MWLLKFGLRSIERLLTTEIQDIDAKLAFSALSKYFHVRRGPVDTKQVSTERFEVVVVGGNSKADWNRRHRFVHPAELVHLFVFSGMRFLFLRYYDCIKC